MAFQRSNLIWRALRPCPPTLGCSEVKEYDWLELDAPVPAGHVFEAAEALRRPVPQVCNRLRLLGYTVADESVLLAEKKLASINLDGKAPWRTSTEAVTAEELTAITEQLHLDDVAIAARLRQLGYDALPVVDTVLVNSGWIDGHARLAPGDRLRARQVLRAAQALQIGVADVVHRYGELRLDAADAAESLLLADVEAVARALLGRFAPGEKVAVWAPNIPEWILLQLGAGLAGLILVTVDPALRDEEARHVLGQSGANGRFHVGEYRGFDVSIASRG